MGGETQTAGALDQPAVVLNAVRLNETATVRTFVLLATVEPGDGLRTDAAEGTKA